METPYRNCFRKVSWLQLKVILLFTHWPKLLQLTGSRMLLRPLFIWGLKNVQKNAPVLCHSQDGFPQNRPQTQKSSPACPQFHKQRVNMWGTECQMIVGSIMPAFPPSVSLSCSVKETVMTACQSLASCGSVCPHLHPTAPAAEQTLCSPASTGRHPITLTLTPALTTRPWE